MAGVRSAAMTLMIPAGAYNDPADRVGSANLLAEWALRGAGDRDSRQLSDHLDTLGLQRSSSASVLYTRFGAAALAARVVDGLPAYADIVRRPMLPEGDFEPSQNLALQSLSGLDDDPRHKLLIALRETFWPEPFGRNPMGRKADVSALTASDLRYDYSRRYSPEGTIFAIAGDIDLEQIVDTMTQLFGDWKAVPLSAVVDKPTGKTVYFEEQQSEQTHIGLAYESVDELHPDYYPARLAVEILSGGMSGRLFTEIREKRALVYSVSANYSSLPGRGAVMGYAGTSNERAQQTLDQFIIELQRLSDGVTADELNRAKTGLKASTIMSGESTGSRAGAIAHDWMIRKRLRTIDQIIHDIDSIGVERVNAYLASNPASNFTIAVVGPKQLKLP